MKTKKIIIIEEEDDLPYIPQNTGQYNDPCRFCPNNPLNNPHASGFCNCALPALCNPLYC